MSLDDDLARRVAAFRLLLLAERFGTPTAEWHPTDEQRAASDRRVELVDDAMHASTERSA